MTRISLKEAYDNRDVIAQIVRLRDEVDELINILKDIDPNGDLTNVVTKTGDQTIDGVKTFIGEIVANCDIIQNGAAYETHAEQVYSHNDYLVMRDGQLNALPAGSYSGLQVKKYDGTQDCRLVVDNQGVARVGDINDEQPLATRDEVADMTSGALVKWDGVNEKLIAPSSNTGSDARPVKVVNGELVAVTNDLQTLLTTQTGTYTKGTNVNTYCLPLTKYGKIVTMGGEITVSATVGAGDTVLQLPDGFRPVNGFIGDLNAFSGETIPFNVGTDGRMYGSQSLSTGKYYYFSFTWITS